LTVGLVAFTYFAGSELLAQGQLLGQRLHDLQAEVVRRVPAGVLELLPKPGSGSGASVGDYAARIGAVLVNGVLSIGVALVLTVYLLVDGRRTFEWLVAFTPPGERPRVRETAVAGREAVVAYVAGNIITSVLAGVFAYAFLWMLDVPGTLLLAFLTAVFDLIPVLGIFLTAVPMVLLALTVSPAVGIATALFNAGYNVVENYYISPMVYGNRLRLSSLAVILSFGVGAELGGVVGALIALPIAAMYPAVENIWLADRLGAQVVKEHREIEETDEH
jgi:predicted PurR-regulated permease PerM